MNTWSSTDKASSIQLSNGNLTASGDFGSMRATHPIPPDGDQYFEVTISERGRDAVIGLTPAGSDLGK